uniref:Probable RNA-binding protein EIF1AD n=1 Tax=Phallusia mammillata TaxID=59560 RepID=A0A6F9DB42_9ASCI|nr:probable RNA-binding protein EIF1AD [Phallusia mammillata]
MTAATKRKHVVKEMLENFDLPMPHQSIVQVQGTSGSNLHEVCTENGEKYLASLPTKFRKNIWIKRGDFVLTEPILEGDKVKGEIVRILYPQHIKIIKQENMWPKQFEKKKTIVHSDVVEHLSELNLLKNTNNNALNETNLSSAGEESEEDDFSDIPVNTNHPPELYESDTDESTDED